MGWTPFYISDLTQPLCWQSAISWWLFLSSVRFVPVTFCFILFIVVCTCYLFFAVLHFISSTAKLGLACYKLQTKKKTQLALHVPMKTRVGKCRSLLIIANY